MKVKPPREEIQRGGLVLCSFGDNFLSSSVGLSEWEDWCLLQLCGFICLRNGKLRVNSLLSWRRLKLMFHDGTFLDNVLAPHKVLCGASSVSSRWFNCFLGLSFSLGREKETLLCWGLLMCPTLALKQRFLRVADALCACCRSPWEDTQMQGSEGPGVEHHWIIVLLWWWVY